MSLAGAFTSGVSSLIFMGITVTYSATMFKVQTIMFRGLNFQNA